MDILKYILINLNSILTLDYYSIGLLSISYKYQMDGIKGISVDDKGICLHENFDFNFDFSYR